MTKATFGGGRLVTSLRPSRVGVWAVAALLVALVALSIVPTPAAADNALSVATTATFSNLVPFQARPDYCGGTGQVACPSGGPPVQVRWGNPLGPRSGLAFTANAAAAPTLGTPFMVGQLTHTNIPSSGTAPTSVNLTVNVVVMEGTTVLFNAPVQVQINIDETPNTPPCTYPSATPCADAILINGAGGGPSSQTVVGNTVYTFQILGFKGSPNSTAPPLSQFISEENGQSTGYFFAQLSASSAVVAHAGPDQTVDEGALVTLNGGGSQPAGVTHAWTQIGGPAVALTGANTATPTFTAPQVTANTALTFRLVTTGTPYTDDDEVVITVRNVNIPPTADPGGPYSAQEGGTVTLNGSGTDQDIGNTLTYSWDLDNNGSYETAGQNVPFAVGNRDGPGSATVSLQVCDNHNGCDTASVAVDLTNAPPTPSIAGATAAIAYGTPIALTAAATDPSSADMSAGFTFAWSATRDGAAHTTGSGQSFGFTPPGIGTYVVTLTATDKDGDADSATATIAVSPAQLTVTADPASRVYGADNPEFTATIDGFADGDDAAALSGDLVCTTAATAASPAGPYAIACAASTLTSPNYAIGYVPGTLAVTTASTTTSADDASGTEGGDTMLTATVTSPAGPVGEGSVEFTVRQGGAPVGSPVSAPVVAGVASAPFSLVGVVAGSYDIEARYLPATSPSFAASADATPGTLTVAIPIIVTNLSVTGSGSYGSPATLSATLTTESGDPLQGRAVEFALDGAAVCGSAPACPTTDASGVATLADVSTAGLAGSTPYALTATYAGEEGEALDYAAASASGSLTLARIGQTLGFPHPGNPTYGSAPLPLTASATSDLVVTYTTSGPCEVVVGPALRINGAGSCVVEASQPGDGNYLAATPVSRSVAIARAPLTLRAVNDTIQFGAPVPCAVSPVAPTTFFNGDTVASLDGTLACTTVPAAINTLGSYQLRPSGKTSDDYIITYQHGTLTVIRCTTGLTLTVLPTSSATYSDVVTFRAQLVTCGEPIVPGTTVIPAGPVQFALNGTSFGSKSFNTSGIAEFSGPLLRAPQGYSASAVFTSNDSRFSGASAAPQSLTVNPEDATPTYSGLYAFPVNNVTKKGTVQLKANVVEDADSSAGDIRTARVRFINDDTGQPVHASCANLAVTLSGGVGRAACSFPSSAATYNLRIEVFGNYVGVTAVFTVIVGNGGTTVSLPAPLALGAGGAAPAVRRDDA